MAVDLWSELKQSPEMIEAPIDIGGVPAAERGQKSEPEKVRVVEMPAPLLKGEPKRLFSGSNTGLSNDVLDVSAYNAVSLRVTVGGSSPSAVINVQGGSAGGGNFLTLPDPNATRTITADTIFDVAVGQAFVKVYVTVSSGSLIVEATPYVAPWLPATQAARTLKSKAFSLTSTGTVIDAIAGKVLKVYSLKYVCSAAQIVNFRDGASTNLEGGMSHPANGGVAESVDPPNYLFATSSGNGLDLVITGAGTVAGRVSYWDSDPA